VNCRSDFDHDDSRPTINIVMVIIIIIITPCRVMPWVTVSERSWLRREQRQIDNGSRTDFTVHRLPVISARQSSSPVRYNSFTIHRVTVA